MRSTGCDRRQQASASLRFLWLLQTPVSPDSHQISPVITEYHPLSPKPLARLAVKLPQGQSRLKDFPLPTPPRPVTKSGPKHCRRRRKESLIKNELRFLEAVDQRLL